MRHRKYKNIHVFFGKWNFCKGFLINLIKSGFIVSTTARIKFFRSFMFKIFNKSILNSRMNLKYNCNSINIFNYRCIYNISCRKGDGAMLSIILLE